MSDRMVRKQHNKERNLLIPAVILYSVVAIATCSITLNTTHLEKQQKSCQLMNPSNDSKLEFTSSQRTPVTVVFQRYISLNCSAKNFCDITWLKDNSLEYPFGDTSWIQLSESKEVLELLKTSYDQKGNYTCIVTDGNACINRTVELFISGTPWNYPPVSLQADTCTNQTANVGQTIEFFCFFYNGEKIYEVNLTWEKKKEVSPDMNEWQPVEYLDSTVYKEELDYSHIGKYSGSILMPTAGKRLRINVVDQEAFGCYRLVATSSLGTKSTNVLSLSERQKADLTAVIAISVSLACLLLVAVSAALTWHFKKQDIMILMMNQYGSLEEHCGKKYDAFICYADQDLPFVLTLRQNLEEAGYNICVRDIDILAATTLVEEIIQALKDSCRCILLISPHFMTAQHSALQVEVAVDQVIQKQLKIIPIIYQDIAVDLGAIPLLKRILTNIKSITWDRNNEDTSKEQLLRHMPPRRQRNMDNMEESNSLEDFRNIQVPQTDELADLHTFYEKTDRG